MKIKLREKLAEQLNRTQKVETADYPVREMAEELFAMTDEEFGRYAFLHDPIEGRFTDEQKAAYIEAANQCGYEIAEEYLLRGYASGADLLAAIARELSVDVKRKSVPGGGGHVIFAQFEEPDQITVFADAAERFREMCAREEIGDLFHGADVEEVLTAHELFHAIEHKRQDVIYTQTEKVELWKKPFSNRSRIIALSEIAAMAFAKRITGLSYSPYVYDVLLIESYNHEAACALYEEILSCK